MKVFFKQSFVKDFKKLPPEIKEEVFRMCFNIFPKINDLQRFQGFKIKPIKGFKGYYRIRLGDYRVGFKKTEDSRIEFMRVKHRKDIYKYFP